MNLFFIGTLFNLIIKIKTLKYIPAEAGQVATIQCLQNFAQVGHYAQVHGRLLGHEEVLYELYRLAVQVVVL